MTEVNTLQTIEAAALEHARARDLLADRIKKIEEAQAQILSRRRAGLRSAIEEYDASRQRLLAQLEDNPHLFEKPKTKIMHGLRIGFMKKKGKLIIADHDKTIAAIVNFFPGKFDDLVKVTKKLVKKSLDQMPAADLKRMGVQVAADVDEPVIKSTDSTIEKLIKALTEDDWTQEQLAND